MVRHPFDGWPKTVPIENGYAIRAVFRHPGQSYPGRLNVTFTPGLVEIGDQKYEAKRIGGFNLELHDKAPDEEREINYIREAKKHSFFPRLLKPEQERKLRVYTKSFHIVMDYQDQPITLTDVFGRDEASKLVGRMRALLELVNTPERWKAWPFDRDLPVKQTESEILLLKVFWSVTKKGVRKAYRRGKDFWEARKKGK